MSLKAQAAAGDRAAARLLELRKDSNFLLTTILWGNVGTNVLLTLLSDSVLAGVTGFVFSTFVITFGGEILPQAYFSRHALKMVSRLRPVLRFWQFALYPLAKPTALLLDAWLGKEGLQLMRESEIRAALKIHTASPESEVGRVEGIGALNFLSIDDVAVSDEGEVVDATSIVVLPAKNGLPVVPDFKQEPGDAFLKQIEASGHRWVILASPEGEPLLALDADGFLRTAVFSSRPVNILQFCHRPIVVRDGSTTLGDILPRLQVNQEHVHDDVIDQDLILYWGREKRIITGGDLLGRLMRGIPSRNISGETTVIEPPGREPSSG